MRPNRSYWTSPNTWCDPDCIECDGEGAPCCEPPYAPLLDDPAYEAAVIADLAERDALRADLIDLKAESARLRPIIDAAFAYADSTADTTDTPHEDALLDAVNDYRALRATDVD